MSEFIHAHLYFFGSLIGLLIFAAIYRVRKDLRRRMTKMGLAVAAVGVLSETVFFQDYWRPPLLFQIGRLGGIEDVFFGFAFGGICAALYDAVFHKRLRRKGYPHLWIVPLLVVCEVLAILVLRQWMNSIYASTIGFILPAAVVMIVRRDLVVETLFSALLGGGLC